MHECPAETIEATAVCILYRANLKKNHDYVRASAEDYVKIGHVQCEKWNKLTVGIHD